MKKVRYGWDIPSKIRERNRGDWRIDAMPLEATSLEEAIEEAKGKITPGAWWYPEGAELKVGVLKYSNKGRDGIIGIGRTSYLVNMVIVGRMQKGRFVEY